MKKYMRFLLIMLAIVAVLGAITGGYYVLTMSTYSLMVPERNNDVCLTEQRVFDYADVLTDRQEQKLEKLIAKREKQVGLDMVIVTICEDVGSNPYDSSENRTINFAEDFYDYMGFGYDGHVSFKSNEEYLNYLAKNNLQTYDIDYYPNSYTDHFCVGAGVIWVDNWYDLNGYAESAFLAYRSLDGTNDDAFKTYLGTRSTTADSTLELENDVWESVNYDPYISYRRLINHTARDMISPNLVEFHCKRIYFLTFPLVVTLIFVLVNLKNRVGKKTTDKATYVHGNGIHMVEQRDHLISTHTTHRRIQTSSGGSGGGGHGGGGGGGGHSGGGGRH